MNGWPRKNLAVLAAFSPVLLATGLLGYVVPPASSPLSGADAYNVFHILAGVGGFVVVASRRPRAAASFNATFGLLELWLAVAGVAGFPPAAPFGLGPADHVVHVVVGSALSYIGWRALRASAVEAG